MNIPEHRKAIDKLDAQLVKLLNERTKHVLSAIGKMLRVAAGLPSFMLQLVLPSTVIVLPSLVTNIAST